MSLTCVMDADHALPDGDEDLVLRDHADLGDGPPAEVLVGPEELDIRGAPAPGPHDHAILEEAPLGRPDKQVVTITENRENEMRCHQAWSRGNNLGNSIKVIWRNLNETDHLRQYLKMLSMERALGRLRMLADVYASCISVLS